MLTRSCLALLLSIHYAHEAVFELILRKEYTLIYTCNNAGTSPLTAAVSADKICMVDVLIRHDPLGLNVQDSAGYTALHVAAMQGRTAIVHFLLDFEAIAVIVPASKDWTTPLFSAVQARQVRLAQILVAHAPEAVLLPSFDGRLPLIEAVFSGHLGMIQVLVPVFRDRQIASIEVYIKNIGFSKLPLRQREAAMFALDWLRAPATATHNYRYSSPSTGGGIRPFDED